MRHLLFLSSILLSLNLWAQFPAAAYQDRTAQLLPNYQRDGIELQLERTIAGIQVRLYLSNTAKQAIAKSAFLQPDSNFSQSNLNQFIMTSFESSLEYFRVLHSEQDIRELNLVIVDRGGDRGSISEVPVHSRIIELHLVRWHKYMLKNQPQYVNLSSIHEFAHIVNYMYSPGETKYHREMTGVLIESLNLIRLYGADYYLNNYRRLFAGAISNPEQIGSDAYTSMPVIRHIAYRLISNLYREIYRGPRDSRLTAEDFVMTYLKNTKDDVAGFDDSLKVTNILNSEGQVLTLAKLRIDTLANLSN
jgi:hypothetical protein